MKIKFCWMRKLARRSRRTKKKENIEVLGFRKIKSRIECKSKPLSYFTFLSHHRDQKRKHLEDLRKEESGVYVDMRKNICEKSLTAVLLEARSESVEEFEYEDFPEMPEFLVRASNQLQQQDSRGYKPLGRKRVCESFLIN